MMENYQEVINYHEAQPHLSSDLWAIRSYFKVGEIEKVKSLTKNRINNLLARYNNKPELIDRNFHLAELAFYYLVNGQREESFRYMVKAIDTGYLEPFSDLFFDKLSDHPRFLELIAKQNKKREEVMALVATYNFPEPGDL